MNAARVGQRRKLVEGGSDGGVVPGDLVLPLGCRVLDVHVDLAARRDAPDALRHLGLERDVRRRPHDPHPALSERAEESQLACDDGVGAHYIDDMLDGMLADHPDGRAYRVEPDGDDFWAKVKANLLAGRVLR